MPKKKQFETEVQKVLDILIYSLYTHKEIFLRELLSNASDALDKINYLQLTQGRDEARDGEQELKIDITTDEKEKVLKISDTGIGMTEEEMVNNLGKIAHSGSLDFVKNVNKDNAVDLIGQFGVGFYSVFMVAKEVRVHSLSCQKDAVAKVWISDGKDGYRVEDSDIRKTRGTTIEIYLKDDEKEFLEKYRLENIIHQYSNFVNFPIFLNKEQTNKISALWTKNKSEITDEQYKEFYHFISKHQDDQKTHLHLKFDTPLQFSSILFLPGSNMEKMGFMKYEQGLHLYCKRVLIQRDNKELLPPYLRFVYGVVDSEDLSLNVSRETIQNDPILQKIKSNLTKKILDHLKKIAKNDEEKYIEIWKEFGRFFKEGIHMDFSHQKQLTELLRFHSSKSKDENDYVSLSDTISRLQVDQKEIYFLSAPDLKTAQNSPYVEYFNKEDIEVLYLLDPIDEFILSQIGEYDGKKFKSIEQSDIDMLKKDETPEEKEEMEKNKDKIEKLMNFIKLTLKDDVVDVIESKRLVDSPVCLVNSEDAPSAHVQKIMKMMNQESIDGKKILEMNPKNSIIKNLAYVYEKNPSSDVLKEIIFQLYENASIALDGVSDHPEKMIKRIEKILNKVSELMLENMGK